MKINQEDFNRKAQHILDTVVKPQVEKYEQRKLIEQLMAKDQEDGMYIDINKINQNNMINYINRYGDAYQFETMPNGNIKWTGKFEWCRYGWPNVYDKAYAQYVADGGTDSELVFKTRVHEWDNEASTWTEFANKYMHLVYSDTQSIDMVDPSGGPYIAAGTDMGCFNEAFKGKMVTGFVPLQDEAGYEIVIQQTK